jgi:hypothetical protein
MRLAAAWYARHHSVEYLQHVLAFLFAQATGPSGIVLDGFTDDRTLWFLQSGRGSPQRFHGLFIKGKCHFYHTDTILPYGQFALAAKTNLAGESWVPGKNPDLHEYANTHNSVTAVSRLLQMASPSSCIRYVFQCQ